MTNRPRPPQSPREEPCPCVSGASATVVTPAPARSPALIRDSRANGAPSPPSPSRIVPRCRGFWACEGGLDPPRSPSRSRVRLDLASWWPASWTSCVRQQIRIIPHASDTRQTDREQPLKFSADVDDAMHNLLTNATARTSSGRAVRSRVRGPAASSNRHAFAGMRVAFKRCWEFVRIGCRKGDRAGQSLVGRNFDTGISIGRSDTDREEPRDELSAALRRDVCARLRRTAPGAQGRRGGSEP